MLWFGQATEQPATLSFFDYFTGYELVDLRHFSVNHGDDSWADDLAALSVMTHTGRLCPPLVHSVRLCGEGGRMNVRFAVLGPVAVVASGRDLSAITPRHRSILAYLLLNAGIVLSIERIIDAVWGQTPPDTARSQVHAAITAVRRILREAGAGDLLVTRPAGYVILPGPRQLDLEEFTEQVIAAQREGEGEAAVRRLRAALDLWSGQPLADVSADYVSDARARLEDRRLVAIERLAELELALGRHDDLIDELLVHVAANPLRERLACRLMLALHRAGRQADALAVARAYRTRLADEQGLDPGKALTTLEQQILRDEPAIVRTRRRFLPYDVPDFAGRTDELESLTGDGVVTIDGMAGIGKSALAIHAAHRFADRYPDGQLFVDLHAHTAGQSTLEPGAALEILLRQLGVPVETIPGALADRSALWRAELAERRVLVILDNAASAEQVRPLLPGVSENLILITSRRRLTDLDGARSLSVDVLPEADSVELFTRVVGERAIAEPLAVMDVLQSCGFLPLAVRIAAARLHHRPQWTVGYLAGRLWGQRRRLAELSTSERNVAAVFALSYQQLGPAQQRMFRLLGLHPGTDFDRHAAAALAGLPADEAETILEELLDFHILQQHRPGRYTFHDLVREHARALAAGEERHQPIVRLLDHYLYRASAAVDALYPCDTTQTVFRDRSSALAWLKAEHANLVSAAIYTADYEWPVHSGRLAITLRPFLDDDAQLSDLTVTLRDRAREVGLSRPDRSGEAHALLDLNWLKYRQGQLQRVTDDCRTALRLSEESGDRYGMARAHYLLGLVACQHHDDEKAAEHYRYALDLVGGLDYRNLEASLWCSISRLDLQRRDYSRAEQHYLHALALCREVGYQGGEHNALYNLGVVYRKMGEFGRSRDHHLQFLSVSRERGHRFDEAEALNGLGLLDLSTADFAGAAGHFTAALALSTELALRAEMGLAHDGLARAHRGLGDDDLARDHAKRAADLHGDLESPLCTLRRAFLLE